MEILFSHVFDGRTSTLEYNEPTTNFILMGFKNDVGELIRTLREKGGLVVSESIEGEIIKVKISELICEKNNQEKLLLRMNDRYIELTLIPSIGVQCDIYIK